mmetsp:Transcript_3016/g.3872  ORF Transcript_3016/g.3872 Transcript_3016/m.3872 type:complete len:98 (+) Transcript_3016:38-331(+)
MMHKMQTIARAIILLLLLISCLQADAYSFGIYGSQIQPKILKLKVDETTLSYKQTLKMTFSSTNRKDFLRQSLFFPIINIRTKHHTCCCSQTKLRSS